MPRSSLRRIVLVAWAAAVPCACSSSFGRVDPAESAGPPLECAKSDGLCSYNDQCCSKVCLWETKCK